MSDQKKCLHCYQALEVGDYHPKCSKKLFRSLQPPVIDFNKEELDEMALVSLNQHLGLTGVQPKISMELAKKKNDPKHRSMIVGLWGDFILKPPTERFPNMSVVEDLTMNMATSLGIKTAEHSLIRLKSGELAYITKRFDRKKKNKKVAVEDFCQLSELLTESKYDTSTEKAGKIILKYSSNPGLDAVLFFERVLFSFITGNADMHLKNFSLIEVEGKNYFLSPAYDLISTKLLPINDSEETALTIDGKKKNLTKKNFIALAEKIEIPDKVIQNSFNRLARSIKPMEKWIDYSFLKPDLKKRYKELIYSRVERF